MRLRPKVLIGAWVISIVPLAGVGVVLTREMNLLARRNAWTVQDTLARRTVDAVRLRMDRAVDTLTFLGRMGDLAGAASDRVLAAAMDSSPLFTDLWIYDAARRQRASVHRLGAAPGVAPEEWDEVQRQLDRRGSYGGPTDFAGPGAPRRRIAVLLSGGRGYLAGRINLFLLSEDLSGLDLGTGGRVFLVDGEGRLVAHSLPDPPESFAPPPDRSGAGLPTGEYVSWDGMRVLGVRLPVPGSDWSVVFEQPTDVALAPVRRVQKRIVTALIIGVVFAAILAWRLGAVVSGTLRTLQKALLQMKEGKFDVLVRADSRDEVGDVARALGEAQPALEKRVRDSLLGRMARIIGHDLRQPVQAARTALDTMLRHLKGVDEVGIEHLRLSFKALEEMDDYIEDILTVGRDRPSQFHWMSLNELAKKVLSSFSPPQTMQWVTRWEETLPPCRVDEREAGRALANAVKNAMEAAGPQGRVAVSTATAEGAYAVLTVEDDGPGLTPEKRAHLFEEFSTKSFGNGLGLLVMKKAMAQHGGKLEINDAPGHGVQVRLLFPLDPPASPDPAG